MSSSPIPVDRVLASLVAASCAAERDGRPATRPPTTAARAARGWYTSPELCSLYGTPQWSGLDPAAQQDVSFWEAVNFYSLNLHGERALMSGIAQRLYRPSTIDTTAYLHHLLAEENSHSEMFGSFCLERAGKLYAPRLVGFGEGKASGAPEVEDLLFYGRAWIFEAIADHFNRAMRADQRLEPVARGINDQHHRDEARHLRFGRLVVAELWRAHASSWDRATRAALDNELRSFIDVTWRSYYNPAVYIDAGIAEPFDALDRAWNCPHQVALREDVTKRIHRVLARAGVVDGSFDRRQP